MKKKLRIYINYKAFNALTIKNRNAFSLIKEILTRLCAIKIYNKFDIIVVFNEIRVKKKNEKKTTCLTRYEFFVYVIMSFELCNALAILHKCYVARIFKRLLHNVFERHFDLQQQS